MARPAAFVAGATLCSRVLGLLREAVFAALFATSHVADAFVFAFRIPNLLRDFFAEGALSAAFVPTLAQVRVTQGEAGALALARRVLGTLGAVTGAIALLGIVFPFLPLVALAAVAMGVLNAHGRFFLPALAPAFFNVASVLGGLALLWMGWEPEQAILGWGVLVLVGGALQLGVQVPGLYRVGWRGAPRVDLRFSDPDLRTIVRRMAPVVLSLAATNLMLLITTALASREQGWASALNYAFRLIHLPIGLIGVALGTVVLAAGARRRAQGDAVGAAAVVSRGLALNLFLALPAAVGLFVLAEPIVRLVYERGEFGAQSTLDVALALRAYAVGIVFYSGVKAAAPAFLLAGDTRTPMRCALVAVAVNLALALSLIAQHGLVALAGAVSAGAAANFLLLRVLARRRGLGAGVGGAEGLRIALAAAAMGLLLGWASPWLIGDQGGWAGALATLGVILAAGALYLLLAGILGVAAARRFWGQFRLGRQG